ncbi:MAG: glycosyltransferase [Clostridiales bacterium]|nr:glycosyltransferase [Clostridiales bacterium]
MDAKRKYAIKSKCPKGLWKAMVRLYRRRQWVHCRLAMHFSASKMKMYCPCCGTALKSFIEGDYAGRPEFYDLSLFENVRQDLTCPACGSLPRHRILAMWGERHMGLLIGKDILYFAPERGMTKWMDDHGISYTTADLMDEDADLSIDIQKTGLPGNSFDVIICNHVLEHVGDYRTALQEMKRILRPGGVFILSFPMSEEVEYVDEDASVKTDEGRLKRFGQSDHVRLFGKHSQMLITEAGFEVEVIDGGAYPEPTLPVTGPGRYDVNKLFVCRVAADGSGAGVGEMSAPADGATVMGELSRPESDVFLVTNDEPVLSIVVPVYNVEKYLRRCVDSLLSVPGIEKTEILLIDDGSTDDSGKIADEYASENMNVKSFHKRNGGLSDVRNYGIFRAHGKYIFFCDADDIVFPDGMRKLIEKASENDVDILLFNGVVIDENDHEITSGLDLILTHKGLPENGEKISGGKPGSKKIGGGKSDDEKIRGTDAMIRQIQDHGKVAMTAWLRACRRDFLMKNELLFEEGLLHEDELWTPKVMTAAGQVLFENEKVYGYRVREDSIMGAAKEENRKHAETLVYVMNELFVHYETRVADKKQRKALLGNWASDYLWIIAAYEAGDYRCRKKVPKKKIFAASKGLKKKIKGAMLLMYGVRVYCGLFRDSARRDHSGDGSGKTGRKEARK